MKTLHKIPYYMIITLALHSKVLHAAEPLLWCVNLLFQILCVVSAYPIQNSLLKQLSGKELVLVPTLTMPVKHNCQYDDVVVGECNVFLAIVCKVIVHVFSWSTIFKDKHFTSSFCLCLCYWLCQCFLHVHTPSIRNWHCGYKFRL